jgi:hypothetical protein
LAPLALLPVVSPFVVAGMALNVAGIRMPPIQVAEVPAEPVAIVPPPLVVPPQPQPLPARRTRN